jgi:predicted ribosome quality control (RQC) complex YloA/Tae2 family protein
MMEKTSDGENAVEALNLEVGHLVSVTKRALKRVRSKLLKQEEELKEAQQFPHYSQIADSLLAHPESVMHGASATLVENIHTQEDETVKLDPASTVFENARDFYKKSRKGKRGVSIIESKLAETRGEEARLVRILEDMDSIRNDAAQNPVGSGLKAQEVHAALENLRILPKSAVPKPKDEAERVPYRHLTLDEWHIYIGKNDAQNDELSTRFARPWDVWMHVAACPGSHVVIRRDKNGPMPPKDILVKVASFTVWFSKAKHTSYADVHFTEARYVHKRRHSPPGEVMLDQYKTLRVSPVSPQDLFGGDFDK